MVKCLYVACYDSNMGTPLRAEAAMDWQAMYDAAQRGACGKEPNVRVTTEAEFLAAMASWRTEGWPPERVNDHITRIMTAGKRSEARAEPAPQPNPDSSAQLDDARRR